MTPMSVDDQELYGAAGGIVDEPAPLTQETVLLPSNDCGEMQATDIGDVSVQPQLPQDYSLSLSIVPEDNITTYSYSEPYSIILWTQNPLPNEVRNKLMIEIII